jgi:hypothetical protein
LPDRATDGVYIRLDVAVGEPVPADRDVLLAVGQGMRLIELGSI